MHNIIQIDKNKDYVAVIAPASGVKTTDGRYMDATKSEELLHEIEQIWHQAGFKYKHIHGQFSALPIAYFSNSKARRLEIFQSVLADEEVKIIVALRGGYGSTALILPFDQLKISGPKILIGFSDITAMHVLFNQIYAMPSIHAWTKADAILTPKIIDILQGHSTHFELLAMNDKAKNAPRITGLTTGGNLTVFSTLLGTDMHPDTQDKILILEDVAEPGYKLHRYLLHLYNAGALKRVKALILGSFTGKYDDIWASIEYFMREYLVDIPVFHTKNIGHVEENLPFTLSAEATIENGFLLVSSPFLLF